MLVELSQSWALGVLIAAALAVCVSWEKVQALMSWGGLKANLFTAIVGGDWSPSADRGGQLPRWGS